MKKVLKHILPIILSILLCFWVCQTPVYASGGQGNGSSGEGSEGEEDLDGKDGASLAKSLFIIYTSDANGNPTSPVIVRSYLGNQPSSTSGALLVYNIYTRFGAPATDLQFDGKKIAWGLPAFTNGGGTGEAIKNWLINTEIDGYKGFEWVLVNYLGFSDDQVKEWESQKDVYLNIEGGMWGGLYVGSHHTGAVLVGSVTSWAKFTSSNNYISRYSHGNMPNSMVYDQSWLGLSVPSNISSKHSSADILAPVGYGIVSVRPVLGDRQVIKCYYTAGKLDNTSYSFADESYEIKDEGSYKAKDWFVSEKKSNRSGDTEFSSFQSELPSTRTYA
jgi:hypothetical protein